MGDSVPAPAPVAAEPRAGWSIDRKVPIALVIAATVQLGVACVWAGAAYSTITAHSDRLAHLEAASAATTDTLYQMRIDVARIAERMAFLVDHH